MLAEAVAYPAVEAGDRMSFADHYRAESGRVARLAYLLTGDRHLAEDLMQEAFLRVGSRLRHVSPETFGPYVRKTVVNLARSQFRRNAVRNKYASRVETEYATEHSSSGSDIEVRDELWHALQQLPTRQREAIVCRFYSDMSEAETASVLGISVGTVKSSTSRGLAALRAALETEER
ncbi:MAG TPA: SigE family RNA polymerase sigma factor [Acidimicrobiia bacterium]|nr:SigE family RNA polymerase sigma factor [Acidimicrobiia bacterium]